MSSILNDIKKMLGIDKDYEVFDTDVIIHINSAFMTLNELGVGPKSGFMISGSEEDWSKFFPEKIQLEGVKTYIYLRVKLLFDPPGNSFLVDAIEKQIKELEWRLNVKAEDSESDYIVEDEPQEDEEDDEAERNVRDLNIVDGEKIEIPPGNYKDKITIWLNGDQEFPWDPLKFPTDYISPDKKVSKVE